MAPIDWALAISTGIVGVFGLCCLFDGARRMKLYGANSASSYLIGIGAVICLALAGYGYWEHQKQGGAHFVEFVMWLVWGVAALVFGALFGREPAPQTVAEPDTKIEPVLAPPAAAPAPQPVAAAPAKPAAPMAVAPVAPPPPPPAPGAPPKPSVGINTMPLAKPVVGGDTVPLPKPAIGADTVPLPKPSVGSDTVPLPKPGIVTTPMAKPSVGEDTVPLPKPAPGAFTPPKKS